MATGSFITGWWLLSWCVLYGAEPRARDRGLSALNSENITFTSSSCVGYEVRVEWNARLYTSILFDSFYAFHSAYSQMNILIKTSEVNLGMPSNHWYSVKNYKATLTWSKMMTKQLKLMAIKVTIVTFQQAPHDLAIASLLWCHIPHHNGCVNRICLLY